MSWRAGIHGYAAQWGVVVTPVSRPSASHLSSHVRFKRGYFTYDPAQVEIWFMHRNAQTFGRGDRLGLEMWDDAYGMAFAFKPPADGWNLVCGIATGSYDNCSVGGAINERKTGRDGILSIGLAALRRSASALAAHAPVRSAGISATGRLRSRPRRRCCCLRGSADELPPPPFALSRNMPVKFLRKQPLRLRFYVTR